MSNKVYVQVDSKDKVKEMAKHIQDFDLISFDIETSGLNTRKDCIIGFSVSSEIGKGYYLPTMEYVDGSLRDCYIEHVKCHDIAKHLLSLLKGKRIIAHNFSFDGRFTKNYYGIDLIDSLWADTMLLVHTVQEEGAGVEGFALKSIAKMVQEGLGLDMEKEANEEQLELKESITKNGGSVSKKNYEIFKADLPILSKYACADTDLTLRIYHYYLKILKEEGLEDFFFKDEVMPLYREVTIRMEEKGVKLDLDLIKKTEEEITVEMEEYRKRVEKELLSDTKITEWIIEKASQQYPPSNKGSYVQLLIKLNNIELPVSEKSGKYSTAAKIIAALPDSNIKSFIQTNDASVLDYSTKIKPSLMLWKKDHGGYFYNIQSRDELSDIAFNVLKIKHLSETDNGKPQFDEDLLLELGKTLEWAKNIRIYNKLLKIKSSYVDRFLQGEEDGRYYFYYKQHATVSGRYGSDAQQLPKPIEEGEEDEVVIKYNNRIRAFLISEEGNIFVDNDYESLEPHVFAHVSGDEGLKDIFRNGWDFYSTIAIKTEKLDKYSPDKKADNYLKKLEPQLRNKAKPYSLGIPYGMGDYALGKTLNVSTKEASELIKGYFSGFPELKKWFDSSRSLAKQQGFIKTQVGRIRHLPKVRNIYNSIGDDILDWNYRKSLIEDIGEDEVLKMQRDYTNGLNNACNFQIQSLSASIVNRAAIQINRRLKEAGIDGWVCAQIHDQLITEVEESRAQEAAKIVQECMENTTKISLQLKAPPSLSHNWKDGH
jgi:DNA polymerase I-like protein with 3'-5' exonuclease and polymerase domains